MNLDSLIHAEIDGEITPEQHAQLEELLRADWAALDEVCTPLTDEQWATPTCLPGWTVRDQRQRERVTPLVDNLMFEGFRA